MTSRSLVAAGPGPIAVVGLRRVAWPRLARRCLLGGLVVLAVAQVWLQSRGHEYGFDFRGGTWSAGRALLEGRSPYPVPSETVLSAHSNGFITPPPLALLGAPLSLLPFGVAIVVFNVLCVAGLLGALRLLGMRDRGLTIIALGSFPFIASLCLGQPDGLFALGGAAAWRWRDRWPGAVAIALIIAAKLLAWPLVIWLVLTRRYRQAAVAAGATVVILGVSWACIGFHGLAAYPHLLAADAQVFGAGSHSILTALADAGVPVHTAMLLTVPIALIAAAAVARAARGSDLGWFTAALTLGILASPVLWQHYLVLLFVAVAATGRTRDPVVWLLAVALWLSPVEPPPTLLQAALVPAIAAAIALRTGALSRGHASRG